MVKMDVLGICLTRVWKSSFLLCVSCYISIGVVVVVTDGLMAVADWVVVVADGVVVADWVVVVVAG